MSRTRGSSSSLLRGSGWRRNSRGTMTNGKRLSFADVEQRLDTLVAQEERLGAACEERRAGFGNRLDADSATARAGEAGLHAPRPAPREPQTDRGRLTSLEALQEGALGKPPEQVNRWLQAQTLDERRRLGPRARRRDRLGTSGRDRPRALSASRGRREHRSRLPVR